MHNTSKKEVYVREVNKLPSLLLLLKAQVYFCKGDEGIDLCSYFAPCFGEKISEISSVIKAGLSYVSKIEGCMEIKTFDDLLDPVKKHVGKKELMLEDGYIETLVEQVKNDVKYTKFPYSLLLLGKPRMVFNRPIVSYDLCYDIDYIIKRFFEFDELFKIAEFLEGVVREDRDIADLPEKKLDPAQDGWDN